MKKTIFLSLVAGAFIFAGCGGGGGGGNPGGGNPGGGNPGGGNPGGGNPGGGNPGGGNPGGGSTTYSKFQYPADTLDTADLITVSDNANTWIINPDTRTAGATAVDKTYAQAVQFCSENNQSLPSPKDLLTTTLKPTDGTSASWAAGKYVAYYTDDIIGQSSNEEAGTLRKVICMQGNSIEKKHATTDVAVTLAENNATTDLTGVEDVTTGLSWTPIHTYDKDTLNPGHANEARFPMSGAVAPQVNAAAYCQKFGAGWRLPTLAEARTIAYLDGTTGLKDPENLKPTVIWTSTPGANAGTSYAVHLNPNNDTSIPYYSEAPEADSDSYFVTCVHE